MANMADNGAEKTEIKCSSCGSKMRAEITQMPMWLGSELNLIENVPAHVCDKCDLQYYDPHIEAAIRALVGAGFPSHQARSHITVPVFRLDPYLPDAEKPEQPKRSPSIEPESFSDSY
mgnify:CR=1 FL=1|jgi:YgiT-type zinc finger domain-containing protein